MKRYFTRTPRRFHSLASAMSAARQALNKRFATDKPERIAMPIDADSLPLQRTVTESKATEAPWRVMRLVHRADRVLPRAEFHAGCEEFSRAVKLCKELEGRSIVVNLANEIAYDNYKPTATE